MCQEVLYGGQEREMGPSLAEQLEEAPAVQARFCFECLDGL